jgi:hypothetical protein
VAAPGSSVVTSRVRSLTSLLGNNQTLFLVIIASLLAAFLIAGTVQRSLLGKYAIGLGPVSVPEIITPERVEQAMDSVLSEAPAEAEPEAEEAIPEPEWARLDDPNLALAGWRIDLEKELRRLAEQLDVSPELGEVPDGLLRTSPTAGL